MGKADVTRGAASIYVAPAGRAQEVAELVAFVHTTSMPFQGTSGRVAPALTTRDRPESPSPLGDRGAHHRRHGRQTQTERKKHGQGARLAATAS